MDQGGLWIELSGREMENLVACAENVEAWLEVAEEREIVEVEMEMDLDLEKKVYKAFACEVF